MTSPQDPSGPPQPAPPGWHPPPGQAPPPPGWNPPPGQAPPPGWYPPPNQAPGYGYGQPGPALPPWLAGDPRRLRIASMGDRLVARIIDAVLMTVLWAALVVPGIVAVVTSIDNVEFEENRATGEVDYVGDAPSVGAVVLLIGGFGLAFLIGILYEFVLIATRGRTLGKAARGLTVRREPDGNLPGWAPAALRYLVLVAVPFGLSYLSPLFDGSGRRQGWHDKAARTLVVKG